MDHSKPQCQKRCSTAPISRSSSRRTSRNSVTKDGNREDKGVNVQVILRCRPLNEDEMQLKSPAVISCNEDEGLVSVIQTTPYKQIDRTFSFDKVFGPTSKQSELFESAVSPIINEVLEGYNCTIFAYGQTGTGKTYTMEGGIVSQSGEFPSDAGIIPRAVEQIFSILESRKDDYRMKVSFLELYNEEITDLLAHDESLNILDEKSKKPIILMEDGKGGMFIKGLEQEVVCSANEIYKILEKGSAERRIADTLLNKQSSRSHTVFSICIHIKESSSNGEELIKCGKLNLVDLAGSENILRAGAKEGRAREAGEINKSLLTLGRVINSLVEHSGHVPYRDSKLTRLLRDSLGGKTKTCMIGTISPSIHSLEETLSTLDYAHHAKNIKNRPEVNKRMIRSELLKDLFAEIDRLRQEVHAARKKNGIHMPQNHYLDEEVEKKATAEKLKSMELQLESKDKQMLELQNLYNHQKQLTAELTEKLQTVEKELEQAENILLHMEERYRNATATINKKDSLISSLLQSEKTLTDQALKLRVELENTTAEASSLFMKIEQQDKVEEENKLLVKKFQTQLIQQLEVLHETIVASVTQQEKQLKAIEEESHAFLSKRAGATEDLLTQVRTLKEMYGSDIKTLGDITGDLDRSYHSSILNVTSEVTGNYSSLVDLLVDKFSLIDATFADIQNGINSQEEKLSEYAQQQSEGHFRMLQMTKSISDAMIESFETLGKSTYNLFQMVEGMPTIHGQKFTEFEKEFEEFAAFEKGWLLEKVAELIDCSNTKKRELVRRAINGFLESSASTACKLQVELSNLQDFAHSGKDKWITHMETTESDYLEATEASESVKDSLSKGLLHCVMRVRMASTECRNTQESVLGLQRRNIGSVNSVTEDWVKASQRILEKFASAASSTLDNAENANQSLLSSIDNLSKLDHDTHKNVNAIIAPSFEDVKELTNDHYNAILKIKGNARQCLVDKYLAGEPYRLTSKKRSSNARSTASIEELGTFAYKELSTTSLEDGKQENGDVSGTHESALSSSRVPLTTVK